MKFKKQTRNEFWYLESRKWPTADHTVIQCLTWCLVRKSAFIQVCNPWYLPYCHVISMSSRLFLIKTWFKHIRHCCGRFLYTSLRLSGHFLLSKFIMGESQTPFTYFPTLPTPSYLTITHRVLTLRLFCTGVPVKIKWFFAGTSRTFLLVFMDGFLILWPSSKMI